MFVVGLTLLSAAFEFDVDLDRTVRKAQNQGESNAGIRGLKS